MKRILCTAVLTAVIYALFPYTSFAQGLTTIGGKIGLNITTLRTDDIDEDLELKSKSGFAVGGFLTYRINEMFAIQPELIYMQKGVKFEEKEENFNVVVKLNLNYIEIPLLAKITIPTTGNLRPNLFLGPALAIKMSSKLKISALGASAEEDLPGIKSTDFGLVFGGGVDFDLGEGTLIFDARYTLGLSNIDDTDTDESTKNGVFSLMAGYSLNSDVLNFGNNRRTTINGMKGSIGSVGAGFGIPYGGIGINGEYAVMKNVNLTAGLGTTVVAGAGFSIGIKYYLKEDGNTWRPRAAAYYGTNGAFEVIGRGGSKDTFSGLSVGLGQKWMFGASQKHGLDLDLMFIVTSGIFDRVDLLEAGGLDVDSTGRIKLSLGYRYAF